MSLERELGIALWPLYEKTASSHVTGESPGFFRVVAGGLGFLSRYHGELREPLVLPRGSQVSIRVARGSAGLLWSHGRGMRPQVSWKGESQGVSRGAAVSLGSLELPRGPEGASNLDSGKSGLLWSFEGPLGIPLELVQGTRASYRGEARNSGFLSSSDMDLRVPMEIPLQSQTSSCIEAWDCPSLSRSKMGVRPPVELRSGSGPICRGATGLSVLLSCWELILGFAFESLQGNKALS